MQSPWITVIRKIILDKSLYNFIKYFCYASIICASYQSASMMHAEI